MTPPETRFKLRTAGLFVKDFDRKMVDAFCEAMLDRNYGYEETLDAFAWFMAGWRAKR